MTPQEIGQLFENNFDCYAASQWGEMAMTEATFIEVVSQQSAALESENKELRKVLKELVELKDMKELIEADNFSHIGDYNFCKSEYERRKPLAWEAARKLSEQKPGA